MQTPHLVAQAVSDVHFSQTAPAARSVDRPWYGAMTRIWDQINNNVRTARLANPHYKIPFLIAGDIFHKWNPPPELINLAIDLLPVDTYAIPGQHDLPHHVYEDIQKSGYWTLVKAGALNNIDPDSPLWLLDRFYIHGFPWGHELLPANYGNKPAGLSIALVHAYIWMDTSNKYKDAPATQHVSDYADKLKGFDVALFGDNHKPFMHETNGGLTIVNCGGLMCRNSDEREHRPSMYNIFSDGHVERVMLDVERDKWVPLAEMADAVTIEEVKEFLQELAALGEAGVDYPAAVRRYVETHPVSDAAKTLLYTILGI